MPDLRYFHEVFIICEGCGCPTRREESFWDEDYDHNYCAECFERVRPSTFSAGRFQFCDSDTAHRAGSLRAFGVELETSKCDGYHALRGSYFGAKHDGSIDGKEFVSAVLRGDRGLDAIENFCNCAAELGFAVDAKCGFHAHFDVSDLSSRELVSVATAYYYTYTVWSAFVDKRRRANTYCGPNEWKPAELYHYAKQHTAAFELWASCQDRYQWFNVKAYAVHRTFELRIHSATLNAQKITNWVKAHIRFIDAVASLTPAQIRGKFAGKSAQSQFNALARIWNDPDLACFYAARARKFGSSIYVNPQDIKPRALVESVA